MQVLFDRGTPAPLRKFLTAHVVSTAYELGWSKLKNGELLEAAESTFDVLVTADKNHRYEQNLAGRRLAILVLPVTSWPRLQKYIDEIVSTVDSLELGSYVELKLD